MSRFMRGVVVTGIAAIIVSYSVCGMTADFKIGYIHSDYVFSKYEPYQKAVEQLKDFQKKEEDKLQKMDQDLQLKAKDADSKAILMTEEMKKEKLDELRKQQDEIDKYYENLTNRESGIMVKKQAELLQPIIDKINEVLMRLAKAEGYDFIFDAGAGGPLLYARDQYNISDHLLQELAKEIPSR